MTALKTASRSRRAVGFCPYCAVYIWSQEMFAKHHAWGHRPESYRPLNPAVTGEGDS